MNSHDNSEHVSKAFDELRKKADRMTAKKTNTITAGTAGESVMAELTIDGVLTRRLPSDEHGVNRISIGGNEDVGTYCTFRGDPEVCIDLVRKALKALEEFVPKAIPQPVLGE